MDGGDHQNQRKGHRLPVKLPYSLVSGSGSDAIVINAESINLSKSGMRLRTDSELTSGQTVEVVLLEGASANPVLARVVWVGKSAGSDEYEFGLEYIPTAANPV
jgi:PilZ domain